MMSWVASTNHDGPPEERSGLSASVVVSISSLHLNLKGARLESHACLKLGRGMTEDFVRRLAVRSSSPETGLAGVGIGGHSGLIFCGMEISTRAREHDDGVDGSTKREANRRSVAIDLNL